MGDKRRLGIIGGGASATLLLLHLAREPFAGDYEIDVFDRDGKFARGVAYGTEYATHRLNVRAGQISAFADQPDDFAEWAAKRFQFDEDAFVPRTVYAQYLTERLEAAVEKLTVRFIRGDVVTCQKTNNEVFAVKAGDFHSTYQEIVLASGNVRLLEPVKDEGLKNYVAEPWAMQDFKQIPGSNGTVVILGSGLSAVDAIVSLFTHGYEGKIVIVSRNGWLPRLHTVPAKYPPFLKDANQPPSAILKAIRYEIVTAAAQNVPWQAVIDSLRHVTNDIWQGWDEWNRSVFLRHACTLWNVHRHRMPLEAASVIDQMNEGGRIRMVRDSIVRVDAPCKVVCKNREIEADMIINALGYRYDEGRNLDSTYKIGPARFGELFETTAIPEIRQQAAEIVKALGSL